MQITRQIKKQTKSAFLLTGALLPLLQPASALAEEVETKQEVIQVAEKSETKELTELERLQQELKSLDASRIALKTQITTLNTKDGKVKRSTKQAQALNLKSQIDTIEKKIENTQKDIDAEEKRLAEEKRVAEEKRKAEEARKAEEERKAKLSNAINNGTPLAGTSVPSYTNHESNTYDWGQCTWGAKVLAPWAGGYWGNGGQWAASASAAGFKTGKTPVPGALVSLHDGAYGHVAYVSAVREDGMIQIMESNYGGSAYAVDSRGIGQYRGWIHPSSLGSHTFIYPPGS